MYRWLPGLAPPSAGNFSATTCCQPTLGVSAALASISSAVTWKLLWTEYVSSPNPQVEIWTFNVLGLGGGALGWLDHEGEALVNGRATFIKGNSRGLSCPFCPVRTEWEDSHLGTRKQPLTRHHICWCFGLGLLSLQNCEKEMLFV